MVVNGALALLNRTACTFTKFLPLIVTLVPTTPDVGLKPLTTGALVITISGAGAEPAPAFTE
jgi:hypothetical protein